jgi:UDP-glucose 4-epimerase
MLQSGRTVFALSSQPDRCEPGVAVWRTTQADFNDIASVWDTDVRLDVVVHLAARVHQRDETSLAGAKGAALLDAYRETNVAGTLRVAKASFAAGAKRFIFLSSVKAMGECEPGQPSRPWSESDTPSPVDAYGVSKWEAEQALRAYGEESGLEVVILRPPLVYGPGVKANFRQLIRLSELGWPLPLGSIDAPRSMVFVENLVDAIQLCCTHPSAAGQIFNVADSEPVNVADLVRSLANHLGTRSILLPVPTAFLRVLGMLVGRGDQVQRLITPLRLDTRHIRNRLHWTPPVSIARGLMDTVADYRLHRGRA